MNQGCVSSGKRNDTCCLSSTMGWKLNKLLIFIFVLVRVPVIFPIFILFAKSSINFLLSGTLFWKLPIIVLSLLISVNTSFISNFVSFNRFQSWIRGQSLHVAIQRKWKGDSWPWTFDTPSRYQPCMRKIPNKTWATMDTLSLSLKDCYSPDHATCILKKDGERFVSWPVT